jgi:hypothetical protein
MEVSGKVAYLASHNGGLGLGLAFNPLAGPLAGVLGNLVAQRCPPLPGSLPAKVRRAPNPAVEATAVEAPIVEAPAAESKATGAPAVAAQATGAPDAPGAAPVPAPAPAASPADRRHFPRLSLGEGFQARFMAGDLLVAEADLTDLSAGGCCLRVPLEQGQAFQKGLELDEFHFLHGDLPKGVLRGRVKWVLGRKPESREPGAEHYCLVGVEFAQTPAALGQALEAYVAQRLDHHFD